MINTTNPLRRNAWAVFLYRGRQVCSYLLRNSNLGDKERMGRDRSKPLRKNWESVKEQVMRKALRAKFEQHAELRALLLATAPAKLVEHTENDAYWGDGGHGKGKNRLGYLLMELREQLAIEK